MSFPGPNPLTTNTVVDTLLQATTKNAAKTAIGAVGYDAAQSLTDAQQQQAQENVGLSQPSGFYVPAITGLEMWGDSITYGDITTNRATYGYAPLTAAALGLTLTNRGMPSWRTGDVMYMMAKTATTVGVTSKLSTIFVGVNDKLAGENTTYYSAALRAEILWTQRTSENWKKWDDASFAYTGTWAFAGGYDGITTARRTLEAGATVTATFTGKVGYLFILLLSAQTEATANITSISVDGGVFSSIAIPRMAFNAPTVNFATAAIRIPFGTYGTHTVTLRVDTPSTQGVFILGKVAAGIPNDLMPATIVLTPTNYYHNSTDTFSRAAMSTCAQLVQDGWNIKAINTQGLLINPGDFAPDRLHPNDAGHIKLSSAVVRAVGL